MKLLFLHGTFGADDDWHPAIEQLPSPLRKISDSRSLLGHGGRRPAPSPDLWTQIVDELKRWLQDSPTIVVAYSLGGRALLQAIHELDPNQRTQLRGVVLEGVHPGITDEHEREARARVDHERAENLQTGDVTAFFRRWYEQPIFGTLARDAEAIERLAHKRAHGMNTADLARVFEECSPGVVPARWDTLQQLRTPLCYIAGGDDAKYLAIAQAVHAHAENAELVQIPGAGHNTHLDEPMRFATELARFVSGLLTADHP